MPQAKDRVNFTDSEGRIMKTKDGFHECYNSPTWRAASRLIVCAGQEPNDKEQCRSNLGVVRQDLAYEIILVDIGFVSEAAIRSAEQSHSHDKGERPRVLAAVKRERHGRTSCSWRNATARAGLGRAIS